MNNIITFDKVSKSFGELKVLDQLNLEVKDGEKLALIGPSGSGKTTLLNHILKHQVGIKTAVLVNEFGEIGIDNDLIIEGSEDMIGLSDKIDHYPHQLSGGQQQRVAIARALAMDPKIMLFDEVTSALDPELVDEVLAVLRKLAADSDTTMLTVTHEMNFAQDFADRVLFFDAGQIVESGSPKELFSNPREERTKSFLRKSLI